MKLRRVGRLFHLAYQIRRAASAARFHFCCGDDKVCVRPALLPEKEQEWIATPKGDMDIIRARLNVAEALAQELRNAKTNH